MWKFAVLWKSRMEAGTLYKRGLEGFARDGEALDKIALHGFTMGT
jgi:hypothetical protein